MLEHWHRCRRCRRRADSIVHMSSLAGEAACESLEFDPVPGEPTRLDLPGAAALIAVALTFAGVVWLLA